MEQRSSVETSDSESSMRVSDQRSIEASGSNISVPELAEEEEYMLHTSVMNLVCRNIREEIDQILVQNLEQNLPPPVNLPNVDHDILENSSENSSTEQNSSNATPIINMPSLNELPINELQPGYVSLAFPCLFPTG